MQTIWNFFFLALVEIKQEDSTLIKWSESLQISVTPFLGHAESISVKKTHSQRTKF